MNVTVDVYADNEKDAIELAKNHLKDYYRLDVHGANHDPNDDVDFELHSFEVEEY